jgi:phosphohistidine phosphatase
MKKIYLIRDAKAEDFSDGVSDFERALRKKGYKELKTIGSYLRLRGISPDIILSSCALRAQQTTTTLSEALSFDKESLFLEELYYPPYDDIISIIMAQDKEYESMFLIAHAPYITELANRLSSETIAKIPAAGVVALDFDIDEWSELELNSGSVDFFIYPKQFQYYMPRQIRAHLG